MEFKRNLEYKEFENELQDENEDYLWESFKHFMQILVDFFLQT